MFVKPRLLVIDDDAQIRRTYARLLGHEFIIETEPDATSAERRIAASPCFDVLLCDLNLGRGTSGKEFFQSLPLATQERMVMCSGSKPDEHDAFAAALGDRFFLKLGPTDALISVLRRVAGAAPVLPRAAA